MLTCPSNVSIQFRFTKGFSLPHGCWCRCWEERSSHLEVLEVGWPEPIQLRPPEFLLLPAEELHFWGYFFYLEQSHRCQDGATKGVLLRWVGRPQCPQHG